MGCCFSKVKADGEGERKPLLAPEPIPASSPGANTGVERRPSFKEDVKDVGMKATLMTGQALLEVAQQVPLLAPVAFLVGAVASSAAEAVVLKEDCAQFQVLIEHLEKILVRAESLEDHGASVNEIRDTLTEALQLMETLKTQGALKSVFVAESQKSRFEDLRVRIQQAIARLNLSAAVDTAVITKAKFRQSEELAKKVEDLGGFEAVVDDPRKMEQVSSMMEGGERVVANVVQRARHDIAEVGRELRASQRLMDSIHEVQEDAVKKATREAELQKLRSQILEQQVTELKAMVSEVRDCMRMFPVPAKEPERMLVINEGDFLNIRPEDSAFEALQRLTKRASLKWGIMGLVNIIGGNEQYTAAGFMPEIDVKRLRGQQQQQQEEDAPAEKGAVNFCGVMVPRKLSSCQHVVARERPVVYGGGSCGITTGDVPIFASPEELGVASKVDGVLGNFLARMMEGGGDVMATEGGTLANAEATRIALGYLETCQREGGMFYAGVPITIEGQVVGSFCVLGPRAPEGFGEKDLGAMEAMAEEARDALAGMLRQRRRGEGGQTAQQQQPQQPGQKKRRRKKKKNKKGGGRQ